MNRRLIVLGLLLALTGCGKAGSPVVPGSAFPHPYPNPNLTPTETAQPTPPEDQPGMKSDTKAKFTDKGSYIDPAVRDAELQRSAISPGSTLPYTQTTTPGTGSPLNQPLSIYGPSPLGPAPGAGPNDDQPLSP
jgi:hypothetical protein